MKEMLMTKLEVTGRTKRAIRVWAGMPDADVVLADLLDDFRPNALEALRVRVNEEFVGQPGFPISRTDWDALKPKTVLDVRDAVDKRVNGGAP
jgi:hypothetical protein